MTALASFSLQQAVVTTLKANSALQALLNDRVFDVVPVRAAYPYLAYGPVNLRDWSTGSNGGQEHGVSISVYSQQPGFREAYSIADAIVAALEAAALTLSGHKLVLFRFDTAEFRRETDTLTTRGVVTFRALTEKL
ncbi:MAG: DUF3168 domain-containing protein [Pseudomonadota bacterium]